MLYLYRWQSNQTDFNRNVSKFEEAQATRPTLESDCRHFSDRIWQHPKAGAAISKYF